MQCHNCSKQGVYMAWRKLPAKRLQGQALCHSCYIKAKQSGKYIINFFPRKLQAFWRE